MMTVTAYLFEYTLNVVCGGNKSECARKLDVRRQDLNRMQKRFADGASSVRTIESILLLFWKEGRSLDQALQGYTFDSTGETEAADASPLDAVRLLREEMSREWQQASTRMQLFKSAETFMGQLEHTFCNTQCQTIRDCERECPCRKFAEFVDWLRQELDRTESLDE